MKEASAAAPPPLPRALRAVALAALAAALVTLVSYPIADPDLWQHLRAGRAIWEWGHLEATNVWTWPGFGQPYAIPSWAFRVLLWPFYSIGGLPGLFVWRWLTTLACFAFLLGAARADARARATGVVALLALLWCAIPFRLRSQVRPDTMVAVLLAAQLFVLERWRASAGEAGARRNRVHPGAWLVAIAWVWVNAHVSYPLGLFVLGAYLLDAGWRKRRGLPHPGLASLAVILGACAAVSFLNPYGATYVRAPFDFVLGERDQMVMRTIRELEPVRWGSYLYMGLPLLLALPVALALARWRRRGFDLAEAVLLAAFIAQGIASQRFLGMTAVVLAPFFARDASDLCGARRWPAWLARPAARAALAAVAAATLLVPAFGHPVFRPAIALRETAYPEAACDAVSRLGVRGKSFSTFWHGGYLIWRFWPERDRLPFMDSHATGSRELRDGYVRALEGGAGWAALDRRWRFDWVLAPRSLEERVPLLETLDADTARWAAVFMDDVAAVFVRRDGTSAAVAESARYRWLPAGFDRLAALEARMDADPAAVTGVLRELRRAAAESRHADSFRSHLADLEAVSGSRTAPSE